MLFLSGSLEHTGVHFLECGYRGLTGMFKGPLTVHNSCAWVSSSCLCLLGFLFSILVHVCVPLEWNLSLLGRFQFTLTFLLVFANLLICLGILS